MKLEDWIKEVGDRQLSKKLKVNITTIGHWRRGHVLPSPIMMNEIEKLTEGKLTSSMIIKEYFSKKENKGKFRK